MRPEDISVAIIVILLSMIIMISPQQAWGCHWVWSRFSAAPESRCLPRPQAPYRHHIRMIVVIIIIIVIIIIFHIIGFFLFTAFRKRSRSGSVDFATLLFSSKHISLWGPTLLSEGRFFFFCCTYLWLWYVWWWWWRIPGNNTCYHCHLVDDVYLFLSCVYDSYDDYGEYLAIILATTVILVAQGPIREIRREFGSVV